MNVASLDLCRELYELSGWELPKAQRHVEAMPAGGAERVCPAYDLGYLLRKLETVPVEDKDIMDGANVTFNCSFDVKPEYKYAAKLFNGEWHEQSTDTPEDAACKPAVELFKQGILTDTEGRSK